MKLTIRVLGFEVLAVSTDAPDDDGDPGDVTSTPVGFTAPPVAPHEAETPDRDW